MYQLVSQLLVYRNLPQDNLLEALADICLELDSGDYLREELVADVYQQVHRLLDIGTVYGFDKNLWHNYLTYLLVSCENPFAITCEKVGACEGSVNDQAVVKSERRYNKNISEKVQALSARLAQAHDAEEFFVLVTDFYRQYGVGCLGLNKAFRIVHEKQGDAELVPISNTEQVSFADLVGYEEQKQRLIANTEAFVAGRPANNVLLFGDSGTGKSSSIKAFKKEIDKLIFVEPRTIPILFDGEMGECCRPLRAQTMQGERVSLALSEQIPAGATCEFTIVLLCDDHEKAVREWLDYGRFSGIGQWRNSGKGRFRWEEIA